MKGRWEVRKRGRKKGWRFERETGGRMGGREFERRKFRRNIRIKKVVLERREKGNQKRHLEGRKEGGNAKEKRGKGK